MSLTQFSGKFVDASGAPFGNCTLVLEPVSAPGGHALAATAGDGSVIVRKDITTQVAADGSFSTPVEDTQVAKPTFAYKATLTSNANLGPNLLDTGYSLLQPTGVSYSLAQAVPLAQPGVSVVQGQTGLSAYQVALKNGFVGTEAQWLASLIGSINGPVNGMVSFLAGMIAAGMTIAPGDASLQQYPVMLAGATGAAFAGIDAIGGLHWLGPISASGPVTVPELDLGALAISQVDPAALAKPNTRLVLAGGNGRAFGTVDDTGNLTLMGGLTVNGAFALDGTLAAPFQIGAVVDADGWNYYTLADANAKLQIFQNYGSLTNQLTFGQYNSWAPQLSADGSFLCFMSDRPTVGSASAYNAYRMNLGGSEQVPLSFNPDLSLQRDISILPSAGQSLDGGAVSGAPITTLPFGHNLSLQGGPMQLGSYGNGNPTALVPLVEISDGNGGGETPCSSSSNQFAYLCSLYKGFLPTIASQSSAAGGHTLDALFQLSAGWYPKMTAGIGAVASLAKSTLARNAYVRGISFVHGESDGNIPAAGNMNYAAQLLAYYLQWIQDIGVAAGTFTAPPLFLMQTSSEYGYSSHAQNVISPQQLAACLSNPGRFYFAGPEYVMQQSYDAQNVHLLAKGYQWIGQLLGTAMFRALVLKQRRTGLMPKLAQKVGNSVYITFHVPRPLGASAAPALAWDTANIPEITAGGIYRGFEARNAAGALVAVTNAVILNDEAGNPTILRLDCASDPGAGGTVGGANTYTAIAGASTVGPSCNLRTLWGVPALYPTIQADATHGDLFDWCAHFKIPYAS